MMPKSFFPDENPPPLTAGERALARLTVICLIVAIGLFVWGIVS